MSAASVSIMLTREIPKMGTKQGCPRTTLILHNGGSPRQCNRARKRKGYKNYTDQKEIELFIFADDMTVYAENLYIEPTKTRIRKFRKAAS